MDLPSSRTRKDPDPSAVESNSSGPERTGAKLLEMLPGESLGHCGSLASIGTGRLSRWELRGCPLANAIASQSPKIEANVVFMEVSKSAENISNLLDLSKEHKAADVLAQLAWPILWKRGPQMNKRGPNGHDPSLNSSSGRIASDWWKDR